MFVSLWSRWKLRRLTTDRLPIVRAAQLEVQRWESPVGMPLTKLEGVWLYERALNINGEIIPLGDVRAQAIPMGESGVTSSPTLTRAAIGGCLFGWPGAFLSIFVPKRRVESTSLPVLQLWIGEYERVLRFKPYHGGVVFELAAMVNNANTDAPQLEAHREQFLREARMELLQARADTPEMAAVRARIRARKHEKINHRTLGGVDGINKQS